MEQEQVNNNEVKQTNDIQVNIYECTTYTSGDGRRVERYSPSGMKSSYVPKDENEKLRLEEYNENKDPYLIGVLIVGTDSGSREIKFSIPNAKTVEEAFDQFHDNAEKVVSELKKQREEYIKKIQSQQKQQQASQPPELKGFKQSDPETKSKIKDQLNISED